jgi:HEAT repeat protein
VALARWATTDNVPALLKALENPASQVWRPALAALGRLKDERAVAPLTRLLTDPNRSADARLALKSFGAGAQKEVIKHLHDKDLAVRQTVAALLRDYGTPEAAILDQTVRDLSSRETETRRLAAETLAARRPGAVRDVKVSGNLEVLLSDPDVRVKSAAMRALREWATKENVPALVAALEDRALRDQAIDLLGKLKDERAARPLADLLGKPARRARASKALQELGPKAEEAVLAVLQTPIDPLGRKEIYHILGAIGTKASLPLLTKFSRIDRLYAADCREAIKKIQTRK